MDDTTCDLGDLPAPDLSFCDCDLGAGIPPAPGGNIDMTTFN